MLSKEYHNQIKEFEVPNDKAMHLIIDNAGWPSITASLGTCI
jgi:hypothetical protein